jgi:hypothetical protein
MHNESLYWLFSASAQSVSAFMGLLLAGLSIVFSALDTLQAQDESLKEINGILKAKYHKWLTWLSYIAAAAIILSFVMLFVNPHPVRSKSALAVVTTVLVGISITCGLAFVVRILDPDRYEKESREALQRRSLIVEPSGEVTASMEFFREFLRLEKTARALVASLLDISPDTRLSFRQMTETLAREDILSHGEVEHLLELQQYRNLVVHGHLDEVDLRMVKEAKMAAERLEDYLKSTT